MSQIHILTACSRFDNLPKIKENLSTISKKNHSLLWHICFDSRKMCAREYLNLEILKEDWIFLYDATTYPNHTFGFSQLNFILTHFANKKFSGFIYTLDDDNLLPIDFFEYNYEENESLIYLFKQAYYGKFRSHEDVYLIRGNNNPKVGYIDQAQMLWHSKIGLFFEFKQFSDGILIEKACNLYQYKMLDAPIVFYNRLDWNLM